MNWLQQMAKRLLLAKFLLLICSLILAAIVLPSYAASPVDWVKAAARAIVGKLARIEDSHTYLRVYGEGVPGIHHTGSDVIHGSDDFLSNNIDSTRNWVYRG